MHSRSGIAYKKQQPHFIAKNYFFLRELVTKSLTAPRRSATKTEIKINKNFFLNLFLATSNNESTQESHWNRYKKETINDDDDKFSSA